MPVHQMRILHTRVRKKTQGREKGRQGKEKGRKKREDDERNRRMLACLIKQKERSVESKSVR